MDQTIPQGTWWSRNWKWFVPVGCLSLLALCGCCGFGGIFFGLNAVRNSRAYVEAVNRAKADPDVQAALGTPIEPGWMTQFSANSVNGETRTQARIPISGPKGEGAIFVKSTERAHQLTFQQLDVVIGQKVIHLPGAEPSDRSPTGPDGKPEVREGDEDKGEDGDVDIDEPDDQPDVTVEAATDRPGSDYRDYEMGADADASKCALDCAGDEKCKAYTFVKPANGKPARCRLKDRAAPKKAGDCCVSGVKK